MSQHCCRIERAENGYEVEVTDPEIVKQNNEKDSSYKNPNVSYVFEDIDGVLKFLKANLDKTLPASEFDTSFKKALKESMDD